MPRLYIPVCWFHIGIFQSNSTIFLEIISFEHVEGSYAVSLTLVFWPCTRLVYFPCLTASARYNKIYSYVSEKMFAYAEIWGYQS